MDKIRATITLEPEVKERMMNIMRDEDKKLSTVINSLLKKYLEQNQENGTNKI